MNPSPPRRKNLTLRGSLTERAVLVFVLLALATLVAVPILVNRRVGSLREQIESSEPARTLVTSLQFNLVRQMAALSELMLTGDTASTDDYDVALLTEDSIYRKLEPLLRELGPAVTSQYQEVRRLDLVWHDRSTDARDLLTEFGVATDMQGRRERPLFERLLDATAELDGAILARTMQVRDRISRAERLGLNLSILLGFLALIAGGAAAVLAARSRRFALESEQRRVEAERALEQVARATELRRHLLQGITHDVKNPLGAAKGYAELLLLGVKAPILPEQVALVAGIQRSVDGALDIIADLLDVARADSGKLSVFPVETDLAAIVAEAVEDHRAEAEAAGLTMRLQPPPVPLRLQTDPARVKQILQNLLSNAVKYTPSPGAITVVARLDEDGGDSAGQPWAVVAVSDTGPGVPPEFRERIFEEFSRLEETGPVQGHGLGLAIARRIARMLRGDLVVAETPPPGATFVLRLPATASERAGRAGSPQVDEGPPP